VPYDITPCPALGGTRVVLLGDSAINRSNNVCREFGPLHAHFKVSEFYDGDNLTNLLQKIIDIDPQVREEVLAGEFARTHVKSLEH